MPNKRKAIYRPIFGLAGAVVCALVGGVLLTAGPGAWAASAQASRFGGPVYTNVAAGGGATFDLYSYTEDLKNKDNTTRTQAPATLGAVYDAKTKVAIAGINLPPKGNNLWYVTGVTKPAAPAARQRVDSQIDAAGVTKASAIFDPAKGELIAIAGLGKGNPEGFRSAARADDPIQLDPGDYPYSPSLTNTFLTLDADGGFVGVEFFAAEVSNSVPLWDLTISANEHLASPSDLTIVFSFDATRLSVTDPDPGNPASLSQKVADRIKSGFDLSTAGSAVRTQTLVLFDAVYHVPSAVLYDDGLGAGAVGHPPLGIQLAANSVQLFWETNGADGFSLQSAPTLLPGAMWQAVSNSMVETNDQFTVTISPLVSNEFFRLIHP